MGRVRMMLVTVCLLVWGTPLTELAAVDGADEANCEPRHVHLSFGEAPDQISILWATRGFCSDTQVAYGTSQWHLDQRVSGKSLSFTAHNLKGLQQLHKVTLTGLRENTTYYYRPLSNRIGSGPYYFKSLSARLNWSPTLLVVGELGPHSALLPVLSETALTGQYDAAIQLGNLAPYLSDENGTAGDQLMQNLEQMAAFMPLMTAPGLHERDQDPFASYRYRFSMPGSVWPIPADSLWYSFNLGPVHFVSYCTDIYLHGDKALQQKQYQWLVKDLSEANRVRDKWPWIIAFGRHPLYCTDTPDKPDCAKNTSLVRDGLEETLFYYGVDLILQSHEYGYERLYPVFKEVVLSDNYTNPGAPVQIISGRASTTHVDNTPAPPKLPANATADTGNNSSSSSSSSTSDDNNNKVNTPENLNKTALKMADNSSESTYGRLHIINSTHLHWELLSGAVGKEGEIVDSLWIVQEHHDKFHLTDLPQAVEEKIDENLVADGGKPGVLDVHDPDKTEHTETSIVSGNSSNRRVILGVSLGIVALVIVVIGVACKIRQGRKKRRVGRRWDSMDYKYGKTKLYTPTSGDFDEDDDDFRDDNDFEVTTSDGKKLINGK